MTNYHVKRNGKLYGPFDLNSVAKCINTEIFTAKDEISDDQIIWMTIGEFQSEKKIIKTQQYQSTPAANNVESSNMGANSTPGGVCMTGINQSLSACNTKSIYLRHYRLIAYFLGVFGIHDFYAGYMLFGIIKFVLAILGLGFISVIWSMFNIFNMTTDAKGRPFVSGGCSRMVYIVLCIFWGAFGVHHLYAGFLRKWVIQTLVSIIGSPIVLFILMLGADEIGVGIWAILYLVYFIAIIVQGCSQKSDSDGNMFV